MTTTVRLREDEVRARSGAVEINERKRFIERRMRAAFKRSLVYRER